MRILKEFEKGNTIYFEVEFRNVNAKLWDPQSGSPRYSITNLQGLEIVTGPLLKRDIGFWYAFYVPSSVGTFTISFTGTIEDSDVIIKRKFRVVETRLK